MGKEFGTYIKELRKNKRITLVELAKKTGLSQPYLSQIENNKRGKRPTVEIINTLASGLDVPNGDLLMMAGYVEDPFEHMHQVHKAQLSKKKDLDIRYLLSLKEEVYYNGKLLTEEQRKKAVAVLDALFNE